MNAPLFPISPLLPDIRMALASQPRLVLEAPPGAGKTTQVPLSLLGEAWLGGKKIVMLEPRRIAARAAAQYMARQLGEPVGQTVGYRIRFETRTSAATRIEVVTEGILTRLMQDDPALEGIGAVLFDEFHERHLAGDLGAALALDIQRSLRPDLRIVVMSATLDGERIARWLHAPRLSSPGLSFPVRIAYPPARTQESMEQHLLRVVRQALEENPGDVLSFLPGRREIARMQGMLQALRREDVEVVALNGELSPAEQELALAPAKVGMRRVVLATNVAESSVTLPGIRAVIDTGLAREPRFDPNSGFTRLEIVRIAQASADQRAGRAGRIAPGIAYRLWPQNRRLKAARMPEILQVELSGLALELAAWGSADVPWLDPPPAGALAQARELLQRLKALDAQQRITALGRRMLELGAAPRLCAAVLRASPTQHALAADLLALMEAPSPLRGSARSDDFRARVTALHAWRDRHSATGLNASADTFALAAIDQASRSWRRRLNARTAASGVPHSHAVGELLLYAFPDRIARQDEDHPLRYILANGRGARLNESTALLGEPWLVVLDLRQEARDSLIVSAVPLDPRGLKEAYPDECQRVRSVRWDEDRAAVEACEEQRFGAIVLEYCSVPVQPEEAFPALLAAIRQRGLKTLPWSESARRLRLRLQSLRAWMPELHLPDLSDTHLTETLETWLGPYLKNKRKLGDLTEEELLQALGALFDGRQRKELDAQTPDGLIVPSGQMRRLEYRPGEPPVLAVKLQELFGLADTPRVAGGRMSVIVHLLSPAGRPIQVTQDLRGFWEHTYPKVKKELKGRYPKHAWPDDPWTAAPTHRAKPPQRKPGR